MTPPPAGESPRPALRQAVLVLCAMAALFTAFTTSLESQRSVARRAASGSATTVSVSSSDRQATADRSVTTTESCSAR